MTANKYRVFFGVVENVLELVVMFAQLQESTKNHWLAYFKMVNFKIFELCLNFLKSMYVSSKLAQ